MTITALIGKLLGSMTTPEPNLNHSLTSAAPEKTLSALTTRKLREAIVKGQIKPGEKLNEPRLAEQYQVSRGPLREAIRRLVAMRLVHHVPHVGATVVTLDPQNIDDLYQVREALEGKAAALAALHMSPADVVRLRELLTLHRQHSASHAGEYMQEDGDFDFHYQIIKGSGNQLLTDQLCDELYHLIRMFRYQTSRFKARSNKALVEHEHLLYAIEQRDPELAEMLMRKHIARARKSIRDAVINQENNNGD